MKFLIIIPRLNFGGVAISQIRLAEALSKYGHNVTLLVGYIEKKHSFKKNYKFNFVNLNKKRTLKLFPSLYFFIKKNTPDIIFSAEDHLNIILLILLIITKSKIKISCSSRVPPSDLEAYGGSLLSKYYKSFFLKFFLKIVMFRANALTCVSKELASLYNNFFKTKKYTYVYNPVVSKKNFDLASEYVTHQWVKNKSYKIIIGSGRLDYNKGFQDLLFAFDIVQKKNKRVKLLILGSGPELINLKKICKEKKIEEHVDFLGFVKNPLKYYSKANIFVMPSHSEGMPNALVEAMMCGCTPVSSNCVSGPKELLQNGKYGYIFPMKNINLMAKAINLAIDNPIDKKILQKAIEPFIEIKVVKRHFKLLNIPFRKYR